MLFSESGEDTINLGPGAGVVKSAGADDIRLDLSDAANTSLVSEVDFEDDTESLEITFPSKGGRVVALTLLGGANAYDGQDMILVQIEDGYTGAIDDTLMQGTVDVEFHGDPVDGLPVYRTVASINLGVTQLWTYDTGFGSGDLNEIVNIPFNGASAGRVLQDVQSLSAKHAKRHATVTKACKIAATYSI